MMCQRIGYSPTSTIGFGLIVVSSDSLLPSPPARMPTFMSLSVRRGSSSLQQCAAARDPEGERHGELREPVADRSVAKIGSDVVERPPLDTCRFVGVLGRADVAGVGSEVDVERLANQADRRVMATEMPDLRRTAPNRSPRGTRDGRPSSAGSPSSTAPPGISHAHVSGMNRWRQIISTPRSGWATTMPAASGPTTTSCSVCVPSGRSTSSIRNVTHQLEYTSRSVEWVTHSPASRLSICSDNGHPRSDVPEHLGDPFSLSGHAPRRVRPSFGLVDHRLGEIRLVEDPFDGARQREPVRTAGPTDR